MSSSKSSQRTSMNGTKNVGEKGENGVTTLFVLSMIPYPHIVLNHAKKGYLIKTCYFIFRKAVCLFQNTIQIDKTYSLNQKHVHNNTTNTKSSQVNMLIHTIWINSQENPIYQAITSTSMNKSSLQHKQRKIITHEPY